MKTKTVQPRPARRRKEKFHPQPEPAHDDFPSAMVSLAGRCHFVLYRLAEQERMTPRQFVEREQERFKNREHSRPGRLLEKFALSLYQASLDFHEAAPLAAADTYVIRGDGGMVYIPYTGGGINKKGLLKIIDAVKKAEAAAKAVSTTPGHPPSQ